MTNNVKNSQGPHTMRGHSFDTFFSEIPKGGFVGLNGKNILEDKRELNLACPSSLH